MPEQIQTIIANLRNFGPRRLGMMAAIAALVLATIGFGSFYLNRPAYETLYVGLERSDVNQIGLVLGEAGIDFDVASDGTTVLVSAGSTAQARMLLAEKGLPTSANAGYELFDNVGSLGLTSFMQQVTRVRALEGEIARTIQSIQGIKAARVHIVMAERANFRRDEQEPTASVVIRASDIDAERSATSIRYLVAAAVPGLNVDKVTVLDSSGTLLAAGDDPNNTSASRSIGVERTVETQIEDNIRRALTPYLGPDNFRASVKAEVNTDTRQTEETIFDPESRVERSVQVVRANEDNSQKTSAAPASVDQNLPEAETTPTSGPETSSKSDRKEETTNYEMNSKRIATVSNGYSLTKMSISVVVNQTRLATILGKDAKPEDFSARIAEIQKMVASATGLSEQRGDIINVSSVEFIDGLDGAEVYVPGILDSLRRADRHDDQCAGLRRRRLPGRLVRVAPDGRRRRQAGCRAAGAELRGRAALAADAGSGGDGNCRPERAAARRGGARQRSNAIDDLRQKIRPAPQDRLARMVDLNEERSAQILRKWAAATAEAS